MEKVYFHQIFKMLLDLEQVKHPLSEFILPRPAGIPAQALRLADNLPTNPFLSPALKSTPPSPRLNPGGSSVTAPFPRLPLPQKARSSRLHPAPVGAQPFPPISLQVEKVRHCLWSSWDPLYIEKWLHPVTLQLSFASVIAQLLGLPPPAFS